VPWRILGKFKKGLIVNSTSDAVLGPRRAAVAFIFITVFLDILAFGLIIPGFPHLIASFVGGNLSTAAKWHGIFATAFMVMQFVCSPIQGALSDQYGRRPVILLSNLGLGLDFILMALAPSLPWLFIGRVLSGVTSASFSTANAYIADVTAPENRAKAFGMIGMAFGLGFVLAPALGGILAEAHPRLPFWLGAGLCLANFCYGLFVLPESLAKENRTTFSWRRANPVTSLMWLRTQPQVLSLVFVAFLMALAHLVYPMTFVLYADYRFDWGTRMVGYTLGAVGLLAAIVQGGLIGIIKKKLGERRMLLLGSVCGAIGFTLYGLAPNGYWFWAIMPIAAFWGLAGPATQAIMTKHIPPNEQGRLQGAIGSLNSVAGIIGPSLFTRTFATVAVATSPAWYAGASFWLSAGLVAIAAVIGWISTRGES
jgi:MFS transporter, DHA1 family, tetracycline resistance protein